MIEAPDVVTQPEIDRLTPLAGIFTAFKVNMIESPRWGDCEILRGPEKVRFEGTPPRIVFETLREKFKTNEGGGDLKTQPRPFKTRLVSCRLHLWGTSDSDVEQMLNDAGFELYNLADNSVDFDNAEWITEGGSSLQLGAAIVLSVIFRIPMVRPLPEFVTTNDFDNTTGFDPIANG